DCLWSLGCYIIKRDLLIELIDEASAHSRTAMNRDIFQRHVDTLNIQSYEIEGYVAVIDSTQTYIKANMDLLKAENRKALLRRDYPVMTKVRDEAPVRYGLKSRVKNALIADGSVIEGEVENSVIFRGVKIGKGAVVKNCVLMQGTVVGENARLEYVCTDKNVVIGNDRELKGSDTYQVFIKKAEKV
ncbi:MAG: glucose-1-phosphate adenylyltransferase subunit GlgD, partial [Clostridia bacterium]|nr:glucose-1-phosphate adenylyltransferase subunit GlgD [Clostridia bacterium]